MLNVADSTFTTMYDMGHYEYILINEAKRNVNYIDDIHSVLTLIISTYVGDKLSKTKSGKPAIVRARGGKPELQYPM